MPMVGEAKEVLSEGGKVGERYVVVVVGLSSGSKCIDCRYAGHWQSK